MLIPDRVATRRPRRGGNLLGGNYLYTSRASATYSTTPLVLSNEYVSFTFNRDRSTGVRLSKFKYKNNTELTNSTSSLWSLNLNNGDADGQSYGVFPNESTFYLPSYKKIFGTYGQSMELVWKNVCLEPETRIFCDVRYTVELKYTEAFLRCSISVDYPEAPPVEPFDHDEDGLVGPIAAISAVCLLNLALLDPDQDSNNWVFTTPNGQGDSIVNPIKNLQSTTPILNILVDNPNYVQANGSLVNNIDYHEAFFTSPFSALQRGSRMSIAHPGHLLMPMVSLGNRDTKLGALVFALDPDGLSAKNFQWWSDANRVRLQLWDYSDHELDPYGLGGDGSDRNEDGIIDTNSYAPVWKACIRPFLSPTKHIDFYAAEVYRDEVVPFQTYIPAPLWKRALSGEIDQRVAHQSLFLISLGLYSGSGNTAVEAVKTYRDIVQTGYNSQYSPIIQNHFMPPTLTWDVAANWNWYPWGSGETGVLNFALNDRTRRLPDLETFNPVWTGVWQRLSSEGSITSAYFARTLIDYNSTFVKSNGGLDWGTKTRPQAGRQLNLADYTVGPLHACPSITLIDNKYADICAGMGSAYATQYFDEMGAAVGCYAHKHTYGDPLDDNNIKAEVTHPRAGFSRYFNKLAYSGYQLAFTRGATTYDRAVLENTDDDSTTIPKKSLLSAGEFLVDIYLPYRVSNSASRVGTNNHKVRGQINVFNPAGATTIGGTHTPWHILSPTMYVALGNRFYNAGYHPHIGNVLDSSFYFYFWSGLSGFDTSSSPYVSEVYYTSTGADMRANSARLGITKEGLYGGRAVVYHFDEEAVNVIPSQLGNISGFESGWLNNIVWSGVKSYVNQWTRYIGTCKDYIPQGFLKWPLEDWVVNSTGILYNYELDNTRFSRHTGVSGEESILHTVRRNKGNNNHLISLFNWTNAAATYSGTFNPTIYGFSGRYDVYSISLANASGTRSHIVLQDPRSNYSFSGSLAAGAPLLLEMVPSTPANRPPVTELTADFVKTKLEFRYSYNATYLSTFTLTIAYSYDSTVIPILTPLYRGHKAAATQAILNNLPQWMESRQNTESNGWKMVNSWGMALESVNNLINIKLRDLFPLTADRSFRFKLFKGSVGAKDPFEFKPTKNLLFNPSWIMKDAAVTRLPLGWSDYYTPVDSQNVVFNNDSIIGSPSIEMTAPAKLNQQRTLNRKMKDLCVSFYVKSSDLAIGVLVASVEGIDGTIHSFQKNFSGTFTDWTRFYLTGLVASEVYRYNVTLSVTQGILKTCCIQLEDSEQPTEWSSSDKPYYATGLPYNMVQVLSNSKKLILQPIGEATEFSLIDIPTRAEQLTPPNDDLEKAYNTSFGRMVDFYKNNINTNWKVLYGKLCLVDNTSDFEAFRKYDIRTVSWYDETGYGTTDSSKIETVPLASVVANNLIYVICKDTYRGSTMRTLKVIDAKMPPVDSTYIEAIVDIPLNLELDQTLGLATIEEEVLSVGLSEQHPNWLVIATNANRFIYVKLFHDYYHLRSDTRAVYTIEDYGTSQLQVI